MAETSQHPTADLLLAYGQGRLSAQEMSDLEAHLASCDACCAALAGTPDDTLLVRAREAATSGFRAREKTVGEKFANPREIPRPLREHPRYRVLGLLGVGGMGAVYKAEHRLMERMVALKVINPSLVSSPAALERFEREVKTAAKLSHPNIVTAHDAEQAGGLHFLVMEFVEGVSLDRLVAAKGPLTPQIAAHLIRQAAQGLQHAHSKGMIHRDIKPQNLMVTPKWEIKILDFGLARFASQAWANSAETAADMPAGKADRPENATRAGSVLGTPDYIAPEQAADAYLADIRADIYSLGCTLYFLLAGEPPFVGGTMIDKLNAHKTCAPTPIQLRRPEVPAELDQILEKMLAKNPADRYSTPEELAKALLPIARSRTTAPSSVPGNAESKVRPIPAATVAAELEGVAAPLELPAFDFTIPTVQTIANKSHTGSRIRSREKPLRLGLVLATVALGFALLFGVAWPLLKPGQKPSSGTSTANSQGNGNNSMAKGDVPDQTQTQVSTAKTKTKSPAIGATPDNHKPILIFLPQYTLYYPDYSFVRDALRQNEKAFKTVSLEGTPVRNWNDRGPERVRPDLKLSPDIKASNYSAIMFLGYKPDELCGGDWAGQQVGRLLKEFEDQRKPVSAICVGQYVLAEHGRLRGREVAVSPESEKFPVYQNSGAILQRKLGAHADDLLITGSRDIDGPVFVEKLLEVMSGNRP